ncbi:MAG: acyl carrier protein [Ignavibacteriaceae bacterium]
MISEKLKNTILRELKLDDFLFTEETTADQVPGWDSLSHINVVVAIEAEFNIRFKGYEVLKCKNVGDLQALVNTKLS